MTLTTPRQSPPSDDSSTRGIWTGAPDGPDQHAHSCGVGRSADAVPPPGIDLVALNAGFEGARSEEIFAWAFSEFWPAISVVSSFQNCVLIDLAFRTDPRAEIIFLDTGSHFPVTLTFVEQVRRLYGLNLRIIVPGADAEPWPCGSERCCELRKVVPLAGALRGRLAWLSGLKRSDTPNRASSPIVGWDSARGMFKVNTLACWTDEDISQYEARHRLPVHPLKALGYPSIGCEPTTRAVSPLENQRAGRWPGTDKTECGLHV
jgi:phosphoadenosine phosphosulfate reductase